MVEALLECLTEARVGPGSLLVFEAPDLVPGAGFSFEELLSTLMKRLGPKGTLVVPTCTPKEGRPKEPFDPALSPSESGPFSEFFRKQTGVRRSHNATHSVAALGPIAEELTAAHRAAGLRPSPWGDAAFGVGSPWDLLRGHRATWLLVDGDWSSSLFIDYVRTLTYECQLPWTKRTVFPEFDARLLGRKLEDGEIAKRLPSCPLRAICFETEAAVKAALNLLDNHIAELRPSREFRRWLAVLDEVKKHGYLRAGAAKAIITPPMPASRWDGKPLTSVYRDLYVRALFLSDGKTSLAFALCDLLGISRPFVDQVRQVVAAGLGLAPEQVMIACTHAHSTPDTVGSGYESRDYLRSLVGAIASAIDQAARNGRSARLGWRRSRFRGIARSRRIRLKDESVFTVRYSVPSTWRVSADAIAARGDIDPNLTVLRVEDLAGNLIAGLSNFGCHPSIALASEQVSGDFSGEAMAVLERVFDDRAVFLCSNGAGGDVDPTGEIEPWGPRTQEAAARVGRNFASEVLESLEHVQVQEVTKLACARREVELPVRPDWLSLVEQEQARMCQEFAGHWQLSDGIRQIVERRRIDTEVQGFRVGDLVLVGLPGEVLVEMGQKIKAGNKQAAIVELANDDIGYIATRRAFSEGGYEVGRHLWGRVTPEAEDILVPLARTLIEELFGS